MIMKLLLMSLFCFFSVVIVCCVLGIVKQWDILLHIFCNVLSIGAHCDNCLWSDRPVLCDVIRLFVQEYGACKPDKFKSTSSLNIESALECFDFLDTCDVTYSPPPVQRIPSHHHNHHHHLHHRHSIGIVSTVLV